MARVLLLEDEEYTRRFLTKLVSENPLIDRVFATGSGAEAVNLAREYKPEIVLLDIELAPDESLNGIEIARILYGFNPNTYFVFITGYSSYAVDSFSVHPYDYILKPIKKERVIEVISVLSGKVARRQAARKSADKIIIKSRTETLFISPRDIVFIEKQDKCTLIHTRNKVYEINQTLSEFENVLGDNFLRAHKSYIVNMDKISRVMEIGNRSYQIEFYGYNKVALMSRYKYEEHRDMFTPS